MEVNSDFNFWPALWITIGIGLIAFEFISHRLIAIFFGAAALVTALVSYMGLVQTFKVQVVIFFLMSFGYLIGMRGRCKRQMEAAKKKAKEDPEASAGENEDSTDEDAGSAGEPIASNVKGEK